jgi:hypothetical protein
VASDTLGPLQPTWTQIVERMEHAKELLKAGRVFDVYELLGEVGDAAYAQAQFEEVRRVD